MMATIENLTIDLYTTRRLQTDNDIERFEDALEALLSLDDVNTIYNMCVGFYDDSEHEEVTYNVLHAIEYFFNKEPVDYFKQIIKVIESNLMIPHALEWREKVVKRIINSEKAREPFATILSTAPDYTKKEVKQIALELKTRNPDQFKKSADYLINRLA